MKNKLTNITPILEHVLGTGEINSAEDLQLLIDALESMPEDTEINTENMAKIMDIVKASKKEKETEVVFIPNMPKKEKPGKKKAEEFSKKLGQATVDALNLKK